MSRITHKNDERGAAAVEFALVLPIVLLLLFGIVEFGRGYNAKITLTHAAREGARAAAIGDDDVLATVQNAAEPLLSISGDEVTVTDADGNTISTCTSGPVTVTVSETYDIILPIPGLGSSITLSSKGTMRCNG